MSDPRFDELAARALARRWREAPGAVPPPSDHERAAAIDAMVSAARRRPRRRLLALAAAASIALGVGGGALLRAGIGSRPGVAPLPIPRLVNERPTVGDESRRLHLSNGREVRPGDALVSHDRRDVVLSSAGGTELWLERDSELGVLEAGWVSRFKLARGQAHAQVSPLWAGERFIIDTADAEVEVHGTVFEVSIAPPDERCHAGVVTRVSVAHGVVEVRSARGAERVTSGEQWPPECASREAAAALAPEPAPPAPAHLAQQDRRAAGGLARRPGPAPSLSPPAEAARPSALPEQNDLFAAALASKRRGQPEQALVYLDRLLARWPDGPLVEGAMAERMRVLSAAGEPPSAARAAREYLRRFPHGFAREEAGRLIGGGEGP